MTTTVKVEAHCRPTLEAAVEIDAGTTGETIVLQDGEKYESYVCDARKITVYEREKAPA